MKKISICTVCMNRLMHLRETLPANIADNQSHPLIEFVVLDYNSQDGMEDWIRLNMMESIASGALKYYKTYDPEYFRISHSKNIACMLSTGDIVCLVDADNFAGKNYAAWVRSIFEINGMDTILTTIRKNHIPLRDQGGKLCFSRERFDAIRGFDESLVGYGIDDVDLVNRLEKAGGKRQFIEQSEFLRFIAHNDEERLRNHHLINNLQSIYLNRSPSHIIQSEVLYFLKDNTYIHARYEFDESLINNNVISYAGWNLAANGLRKGMYEMHQDMFVLNSEDNRETIYRRHSDGTISCDGKASPDWEHIPKGHDLFYFLIMGYGESFNRKIYMDNDRRAPFINPDGFGHAAVYRNFNLEAPIRLSAGVLQVTQ